MSKQGGLYKVEGSPYWYISYVDVDGRRKRKSTRTKKKGEATVLLQDHLRRIRMGEPAPHGKKTIDDLCDSYLVACEREKGQNNVEGKRGHFDKWILPIIGNVALGGLNSAVVEEFKVKLRDATKDEPLPQSKGKRLSRPELAKIDKLKSKGKWPQVRALSDASINRIISTLTAFIRWAVKKKYTTRAVLDEVLGVDQLPEDPTGDRYLTERQITRLLKACDPVLHDVVLVALNTGARIGELIHRTDSEGSHPLKWDSVDLEHGFIQLRGKRRRVRQVPINDELREVLKSHPRGIKNPYVFMNPEKGTVLTYNEIRPKWEAARIKADVPEARLHDLRHTAASYLAMRGVNRLVIAAILGHTNMETTDKYLHLSPDALAGATDKLHFKRQSSVKVEADERVERKG